LKQLAAKKSRVGVTFEQARDHEIKTPQTDDFAANPPEHAFDWMNGRRHNLLHRDVKIAGRIRDFIIRMNQFFLGVIGVLTVLCVLRRLAGGRLKIP